MDNTSKSSEEYKLSDDTGGQESTSIDILQALEFLQIYSSI